MKRLACSLLACSISCAAPEGEMGGTETDTETGSSGSDTGMSATVSSTVTASTTMSTTTSASTTTTATTDMTTVDPDTGDSSMSATEATTGDCPPGDLGCPCDIGSTCSGELMCVDGTCVDQLPCDEPEGEPNDDEASAVALDEVDCSAPGNSMGDAALAGAESDWFTLHAVEGFTCFGADPQVTVTAETDLAVCLFAVCDQGNTGLGCSGGASESDSPDGVAGCCDQNQVGVNNLGCGVATPRDVTLYVRVTSVDAACIPYQVSVEY